MKHNDNRDRYERDGFFRDSDNGDKLATEMVSYTDTENDSHSEPPEKHGKKKKERAKKPTKQERKELRKQQAQLEKELVAEGKIAPRYRYIPRNNFARIFCICLAFVFGFFAAFGVLVGGFAYYGTQKNLKEVSEVAGFDYSTVFTETAAELSTLELVMEIVEKYRNDQMNTLQSYAEYTPFADTMAEFVVTQLADAEITVDKDELMTVPLKEFGAWFQEKISDAFGDINSRTLGEVLDIDENSPAILQALKDTLICDLGDKAQNLTLSEILGEEALKDNKILRNLGGSTLDTLSADVQKLSVEQVFGDEMYSYLSITANERKTYKTIVNEYKETNRKTEEGSRKVPKPVELGEDDKIVTVTEEDETIHYYLASDSEHENELDRYLDGVWYLLFGDEGDTNQPILEIDSKLTEAVKEMNGLPLWELWLHGLINENPYQALPKSFKFKDNDTVYGNLNEFTVKETILYIQAIINDHSWLIPESD